MREKGGEQELSLVVPGLLWFNPKLHLVAWAGVDALVRIGRGHAARTVPGMDLHCETTLGNVSAVRNLLGSREKIFV